MGLAWQQAVAKLKAVRCRGLQRLDLIVRCRYTQGTLNWKAVFLAHASRWQHQKCPMVSRLSYKAAEACVLSLSVGFVEPRSPLVVEEHQPLAGCTMLVRALCALKGQGSLCLIPRL